ncbi:hypothetical protein O6H91_07G095900 [Diphasiastrum complanatum]|uniref:Uncharacterized protein n=1 Tax=Diphasiastrum complanatum TaxID=34168 RepID=A0ACC2D875_DIPCM|nr:hypothetical protein O6H91_07G095900 [Diphasiastrum complanatum]
MASLDEAIAEAAKLIAEASSVVAFTGAGISVESGIPDFRSAGGLWSKYDPSVYCSYQVFLERPELFWKMALEIYELMSHAKPNAAHVALAELENCGLLSCVITQNVDNLHQRAGNKKVYELHGNAITCSCITCKTKFACDDVIRPLQETSILTVPKCNTCQGILKLDVVLFGEALPSLVVEDAMTSTIAADVLLVVGTSLTVSPANSLVDLCRRHQGKVIICDRDSSKSFLADVKLTGNAGEVLPRLVDACKHICKL